MGKVAELITDVRHDMARIIKGTTEDFHGSFFDRWEGKQGKWQPTNFKKQVESNESWVYTCAAAIAEAVAMSEIQLYAVKNGVSEPIENHIFWDLWSQVNPFMNNMMLRQLTETYQLLTGNAYWYVIKNVLGAPEQIWPVPPQYVTIVPDKEKFIKGYLYKPDARTTIAFTTDEIIHFKYPNPNNQYYGMGPVLAAAYEIDMNTFMNQYQSNLFKNEGVPGAVLSSDQVIQEALEKRMRMQWNQMHQGPNKAGKVAILSKGLTFKALQLSARELAFIDSKNVNKDTILGIFRVPPSILGLTEDVNRANAEAAVYTFNLHNIKPKLKLSQEKLNEQLMPMYPQREGVKLTVEYEDPVPKNRELLVKEQESHLKTGYSTINMEREANGLKPVPWGDVPLMPFNIVPLGAGAAAAGAGDNPKPKPKADDKKDTGLYRAAAALRYKARFSAETYRMIKELRKLFRKQEKEVLANLKLFYVTESAAGKPLDKETIAAAKDGIDAFMFIRIEAEEEFAEEVGPEIAGAYEAGARSAIRLADLDMTFSLDNPAARTFLDEKIHRFAFEVNDTTIRELKTELTAGMEAGENLQDLSGRVKKTFNLAEQYRATRIARTEVAEAENQALDDTWKQSGVVEEKEWLHGGGGLQPRPQHVEMNGERVKIGEPFSNGLMHPGDPTGGPEEVINCTCSMLPHVKK